MVVLLCLNGAPSVLLSVRDPRAVSPFHSRDMSKLNSPKRKGTIDPHALASTLLLVRVFLRIGGLKGYNEASRRKIADSLRRYSRPTLLRFLLCVIFEFIREQL